MTADGSFCRLHKADCLMQGADRQSSCLGDFTDAPTGRFLRLHVRKVHVCKASP